MLQNEAWNGFEGNIWRRECNVRDFIQKNYTPYEGDESFLADPTEATNKLWGRLQELQKEEREKGGVLDEETEVVSSLTAYGPGYIDESMKDLEQLQVRDILRETQYLPVRITVSMEELLTSAMNQNFIPVVDDSGSFIGIVTRKDIIRYFSEGKQVPEKTFLQKIV